MATLEPFPGLRYSSDDPLEEVIAPPYDVISRQEVKALRGRHPHNIVHVTLGPGDGSEPDEKYRSAAEHLRSWLATGVLDQDPPSFYLYRCDYRWLGGPRTSLGVVGALELEPLGGEHVLPHERTMPGPKTDRLRLMRSTQANLEPLWFVATRPLGLVGRLVDVCGEPIGEVVDSGGERHRLFRVPDARAEQIRSSIAPATLVIADGHHRYETALAYRDERRQEEGPGAWDYVLALIEDPEEYPPELRPIHRVAEGVSLPDILRSASLEPFPGSIEDLAIDVLRRGSGTIGVALPGALFTMAVPRGELDAGWLSDQVLGPLGTLPSYEHDLERVLQAARAGSAAFLLAPVDVAYVTEAAVQGVRMPPKTTLFWPKPLSGLVMRDLQQVSDHPRLR